MPTPRFLFVLLLALPLALTACDSSDPEPTTGTISGAISLPSGAAGDIVNTRVALFETLDEFRNNAETFSATADADGTYRFENINPDSYFLAAFKDNDNSGDLSSGDFYGYLGGGPLDPAQATPQRQQVTAGENVGIDFVIQIVPPGFGLTVTGTYTGTSASGDAYNVTLTENAGTVTGTGTIVSQGQTFPVTTTGTFNPPNISLSFAIQNVGTLPFTGTVSDDGSSITGLLDFGANGTDSLTLTRQ
jgi:hypothetical protein